ncbi:fibroblast growth factor-binding protein 1 [Aulostomus maculatus]
MLLLPPPPPLAPCLLMVFLAQQVSLSSCAPDRGAQGSGNRSGQGRFTLEGTMRCTWSTRDVADTVKLTVKCQDPEARVRGGNTELSCDYSARPQSCPGYLSDPRGFWKQVSRSLKKLKGKLCKDERALVKAGMCKRAPRDPHFRLDLHSSVTSSQSGGVDVPPPSRSASPPAPVGPTPCTVHDNHRKTAEEYCSSSWTSVCVFFLSVLQNEC